MEYTDIYMKINYETACVIFVKGREHKNYVMH